MRDIYHMHQQVSLSHLVKGTLETLNQVRGQLTDKADGICQQERQVVDGHLPHGSIERSEELVLGKHLTLGQQIHDGTLTHVRITDQGHTDQATTILALSRLLLVNLCETLFQQGDTLQDDSSVHLQLGLTRTTKAHRTLATA